MRGTYKYAPLKFILTKLIKSTDPKGKEQTEQVFLEGEYMMYQQAQIEMKKLTKGDYVMFMKAEWDALNLCRRLVFNVYAPDPITLRRASNKKYSNSIFAAMD